MSDFKIEYKPIFIDIQYGSTTTKPSDPILGNFFEGGKLRFATAGIGWKGVEDVYTAPKDMFRRFIWFRGTRQFELSITLKDNTLVRLQGFHRDDYDKIKDIIRAEYGGNLETREFSLKGWNWGTAEFEGTDLIFGANDKPTFEIPLSKVANTNLVGKNEVSLEFLQPEDPTFKISSQNKKYSRDELVEMRFYIPNSATIGKGGKSGAKDSDDEGEARNAAAEFYETIKDRADLQVSGEAICLFSETLFVTPRGRYEIDMFPTFFRLRGKTYDYKVLYTNISKLFYLPKHDGQHMVLVIGLDPPLRQGQTRYSHLVLQWAITEELDIELSFDDPDVERRCRGKLEKQYSKQTSEVVSEVFKVLADQPLIKESSTYTSHRGAHAFKCSLKANEGHLYPLDKSFLFIPKPALEILHSEIGSISFSRVGAGSVASSRTFDLRFNLKGGTSHQFSSINREEFQNIELYLRSKSIRFKDEQAEQAMQYSDLDDSSDGNDSFIKENQDGSDLDGESPDEDFVLEEESEVGEEFDENYTEGSGEDEPEEDEEEGKVKEESA